MQLYYETGLVILLNYELNCGQNHLEEVAADTGQH